MSSEALAEPLFEATSPGNGYWSESRRPLPSLVFVLPLLAAYEWGVTRLTHVDAAVRNGADHWMRCWLLDAGLIHAWVLPILLLLVLGTWHVAAKYPWRIKGDTLTGMFGESLLFALLLVVAGQSLNLTFQHYGLEPLAVAGAAAAEPSRLSQVVGFLGAGIYEEVMFRLALIPVGFYLLRALLIPRGISIVLAVAGSSTIFAAAHYLDAGSGLLPGDILAALERVGCDSRLWYGFAFRLLAGVLFSLLLLFRGFGITVGCHALYDVFAGVVMQGPGE
jgi:hypothetical protein